MYERLSNYVSKTYVDNTCVGRRWLLMCGRYLPNHSVIFHAVMFFWNLMFFRNLFHVWRTFDRTVVQRDLKYVPGFLSLCCCLRLMQSQCISIHLQTWNLISCARVFRCHAMLIKCSISHIRRETRNLTCLSFLRMFMSSFCNGILHPKCGGWVGACAMKAQDCELFTPPPPPKN